MNDQEVIQGLSALLDSRDERLITIMGNLLRSELVPIKSDLSEVKSDLIKVESRLTRVESDLSGVKTDLSGVKTDLSGVRTDLSEVKERVKCVELKLENEVSKRLDSLYDGYQGNREQIEELKVMEMETHSMIEALDIAKFIHSGNGNTLKVIK